MQSLWMIVASFLFACMGVCVKLAAARYSAAEVVFYRSFISLLIMVAVVRLNGVSLRTNHWRFQLQRGISGFLALFLYFYAISMLPLATAVTLNYTSAIWLALILLFVGVRVSAGAFGALAVGLVGIVILLKPTFSSEQLLGGLIGLGSGILAGVAFYNVKELGKRGEPETRTVFYFSLLASIGSGLWQSFFEWQAVDWQGGLLLFAVAAFATGAQLAMTRAYARGQTVVATSFSYSTVVFATLFGMLLWDEHPSWDMALAVGLIIASGVATSRFSRASPAEQD